MASLNVNIYNDISDLINHKYKEYIYTVNDFNLAAIILALFYTSDYLTGI